MPPLSARIRTKAIYERPSRADGTRVLVDLWPRSVAKERTALDRWLRQLAPSGELQRWFQENPQSWTTFRRRYFKELKQPDAVDALNELYSLALRPERLTLLFASEDEQHNHAVVLKQLLEGMRKPPTGTGPLRSIRQRKANRARV
jgi:uncharacterized protein YeaO (DUF488 family)